MKKLFSLQVLFTLATLMFGCELKPTYSQCSQHDQSVLNSNVTQVILAGPYAPNCFAYDADATGSNYPMLDYYVRFKANGIPVFPCSKIKVRGLDCPAVVITVLGDNCDSIYSQRLYTDYDSLIIEVQIAPPFTVVFSPNMPDTISVEWLQSTPLHFPPAIYCNTAPVSIQNPSANKHGWAKFPPTAFTAATDSIYPPLPSGMYIDSRGLKIKVIQGK